MDWDKMEGEPYSYFTFGVCCCEVELDCLTGDYRVRSEPSFILTLNISQTHSNRVTFSEIETFWGGFL